MILAGQVRWNGSGKRRWPSGNRRVQLTGFITPGPNGQPILARMILSCCAADGRPAKLGMAGNAPTGLANDTWIQVTGRYTDRVTRDPSNDKEIPYIDVDSWRQVTAPPRTRTSSPPQRRAQPGSSTASGAPQTPRDPVRNPTSTCKRVRFPTGAQRAAEPSLAGNPWLRKLQTSAHILATTPTVRAVESLPVEHGCSVKARTGRWRSHAAR